MVINILNSQILIKTSISHKIKMNPIHTQCYAMASVGTLCRYAESKKNILAKRNMV